MYRDTWYFDGIAWKCSHREIPDSQHADLVMVFGDTDVFKNPLHYEELKSIFPDAHIVGASSSGNILGSHVCHFPLIATAIKFDTSRVLVATAEYHDGDDMEALTETLVSQLPHEELRHLFLLSDGLTINGSDLVRGINRAAKEVSVSGGMAGDGDRFQETYIIADSPARQRCIAIIGFYGSDLRISSGCFAGWSEFGAERMITKSDGNVLYEIDGEPALDLYKKYLGTYAADLPNSGLRFPLSIRPDKHEPEVIRTLLAINESDKSITFAGDVPIGYFARLMKPDMDALIGGAATAAKKIDRTDTLNGLGLVVSCVGRKIIMSQLVDEELEAVQDILGENVQLCGFYSYGEIAPFDNNIHKCELHNQTMTLTVIYEG